MPQGLAIATLLLHVAFAGRYGYFRDELYYMVGGERLAFGYADYAPWTALVAGASRALLGDSLLAIRLLSALAGAATVFATAWMARELGGGRFAQVLAGTTVLFAPLFRITAHMLSPIPFDVLWWTLAFALWLRLLRRDDARLFVAIGVVAGIGLETKPAMLLFGLGLAVGLAATPERRYLKSRPLWLGGALALALYAPNLWWQATHGWPTFAYVAGLGESLAFSNPVGRLANELLLGLHPLSWPIAGAGLVFALRADGRRYRSLGIACAFLYALLLARRGKAYYFAPLHPPLLALGAYALERTALRTRRARTAALAWIAGVGLVALPMALPILPIPALLAYSAALGQTRHGSFTGETQRLPLHFADMLGWPELVAEVARVYDGLDPAQRERTVIFARFFGEAAAIDVLGDAHGLPDARSADMNYYFWGPGETEPETLVLVGVSRERADALCERVELAAVHEQPLALAPEQRVPIRVCSGLRRPLREAWPELRTGF